MDMYIEQTVRLISNIWLFMLIRALTIIRKVDPRTKTSTHYIFIMIIITIMIIMILIILRQHIGARGFFGPSRGVSILVYAVCQGSENSCSLYIFPAIGSSKSHPQLHGGYGNSDTRTDRW